MNAASLVPARVFVAIVLFAIALPAFYQQTLGTGGSDIPTHFGIARDIPYPSYSILSVFVGGLLWAGADRLAVGWVAIVLLSACVALKGTLSFGILSKHNELVAVAECIAVALAFVMPIVNWWNYRSVYLGQIAPTIWHNSTTVLVMPVVVLRCHQT